ncbi:MAG: GAF domain-containing protein [Salinivirgaceae bacterium]|jgi:methyl-accepting chemotaxis protein|nr:GAF domain-containing protein [Salinivirgaceae bacterium]
MKFRLILSIRMLLFIVSAAAIVFFSTLRIINQNFKKVAYTEAKEADDNQAKKYASEIQTLIEVDFEKIRSYKQIVEGNSELPYTHRRVLFNKYLEKVIQNNADYSSVWDAWELKFTDENWMMPNGYVKRSFLVDEFGWANIISDSLDLETDNTDALYYKKKQMPKEGITLPYKSKSKNLEASILVPLNINNQFAGLTGFDLKLNKYQTLLDSINSDLPFEVMLLASNGDVIAHPIESFVGSNIRVIDTLLVNRFNIKELIAAGKPGRFVMVDDQGVEKKYYSLKPFTLGNTESSWAILIVAPLTEIETELTGIYKVLSNAIKGGLVIIGLVVLGFGLSIVFQIRKTRNILTKLASGDVHNIEKIPVKSADELGEMALSLNTVIDGLNSVTDFAEKMGDGNYDFEFKELSADDTLGHAVIEMRNSLQIAKNEEDARLEQARQLEWASNGMNIFNRVLRVDNRNLEELAYEITKTITTYLDAHMGGLYVKTDLGNTEFELLSFIGFNKEKYSKKFIQPTDGLAGQCILERETIFVNDVPEDYDVVSSGLGKSIPRAILVVPLISNRVLVGVLEIESLKDILPYQIKFVERIAETIASTVSTVKTNARTEELLDKAKKQAEELEQQEEEMRQNMEEMNASQEESSKQETELAAVIEGINRLLPVLTYDTNGKVIDANDNYLKIYRVKKNQIVGKQHKADLFMNETEQSQHKEFWNNLANGQVADSLGYIKAGKDDYWLLEKFLPIKDQYGLVQKVLCIGIDVTEQQKTESKIKQVQDGVIKTKDIDDDMVADNPVVNLNQKLKVIDLTYLKMVYKKNPAKIYNIIKLYYNTLPNQIVELEEISNNKDYKKLKSRINGLKTKMSYLGLKNVYEQLRDVERILVEDKNLAEVPEMISVIKKYWLLAFAELQQLLRVPGYK